jgi:IS605 OrfB family transposase
MRTAYKCRAYPDEAQQAMLSRTFGCVRVVWNRTLAARHARWHVEGKGTSYAETDRALTAMKRDFLHKVSTRLVRENDVIAVEDLNVCGMVRNRRLARAISCTGWAEFRSMLEYKAQRHGRTVVAVDRWYPSSKTCSACGHRQ